MKAYKERKANEPEASPEEKPSKKGSVKDFFGKKDDKKKSSPRKSAGSGESQKFKSAEFVDTDDSSSEEEKVSCLMFRHVCQVVEGHAELRYT